MTTRTSAYVLSPVAEQRHMGFRGLLFSDPLEEDFKRYYSEISVRRARVMPSFSIVMTLIATYLRLSGDNPNTVLLAIDFGIILPLLFGTLYVSTIPDRHRLFQTLLALNGLLVGIVIIAVVFKPTLEDMPSYMPIEVAWLFSIWLILGLRFRVAALTALTVSAIHIVGIGYMNFDTPRAVYETILLILINGIGAIACYHLEYATRHSFLESREVNELADELTKLAHLDGLTGLQNRRSHDEHINRIWHQAQREQVPLAILLFDIDHFKAYNDYYGHQKGDDALISVAKIIASGERRPLDFAARYGGEEFVLALYGQDRVSGEKIAESLRKEVRGLKIPHAKSTTCRHLTVSIGVANILPDTERSVAGSLQLADEALYQAKDEGRNRVVVKESHNSALRTGKFRTTESAAV